MWLSQIWAVLPNNMCFHKVSACVYSLFDLYLCLFAWFLTRSDMRKMQESKSTDNIQFLPFLTTCLK